MIIILSFFLAFGLSAALVAFQEYIDDTIRTPTQLKELTNIPVFSTFSYIETREEKRQRQMRSLIWVGAALSCIVIFLVLINIYVIKLDQAWEVVLERIMMIA
jgi:hypothetical protein